MRASDESSGLRLLFDERRSALVLDDDPHRGRWTASQNPRALPPPTLQSLAGQLGGPPCQVIRDPRAALVRARKLAGPAGLVVATGSIYLVADLLRPAGAGRASML